MRIVLLTLIIALSWTPVLTASQPALPVLEHWLHGPIEVEIRDEVTDATDRFQAAAATDKSTEHGLAKIDLQATERWADDEHGLTWELDLAGTKTRVGHEVIIELPMLTDAQQIFTPGERGTLSLAAYPTYRPATYGHFGWTSQHYVLPLASVFDPKTDRALTIALPPDQNIPHLQFEWTEAKTLRLRLSHRAAGGGKPSPLRLRFYAHKADYRAVLKAYSDEFPRFFKPKLPRGQFEGPFWYHHIQDHPDFEEMARQNIRSIWMSFWFTHLGEYLPDETEWAPYTYARWWKLEEMMTDEKIRAFVRKMHGQGIGAYAYFNVTEYGGIGGAAGDTKTAERILREQFADALMKNEAGQAIPTWEGSMAMNAGRDYSLFPFLVEQLRRHLTRLPEIDGFVIDRLDWASMLDYGHDDGQTMVGDRPAENMVHPVSQGVGEVCRQSHAAGKRVIVNQFWRVEMLRDVDGYCHEADYLPGLGYLSPYRPVAAWHHRKPYSGDLLQFEGQLKQRLQFALMPQMIAHEFPISQQGPDPEAADLMEIYAPLFATLDGKEQVLLPHCIEAAGSIDVNLFVNRAGHYVAPLTSRTRFLARRVDAVEETTVTLRVPDADELRWAYVVSADSAPYRAAVVHEAGTAKVVVRRHGTSSMVVVGKGTEPALPESNVARIAAMRERLFPLPEAAATAELPRPSFDGVEKTLLRVAGTHLGLKGNVLVSFDGKPIARSLREIQAFAVNWPADRRPEVTLTSGDEAIWYVPREIKLVAKLTDGRMLKVARWTPARPAQKLDDWGTQRFVLGWIEPEEVAPSTARFAARDAQRGGSWHEKFGAKAAWIPRLQTDDQNGFRLRAVGNPYAWINSTEDARVLQSPGDSSAARPATCWFGNEVQLSVVPPDSKPYRLTVYLLDFDRDGRAMEASLRDGMGIELDRQKATVEETAAGVYLTWRATGPLQLDLTKTAGFNAVVSGVFVDPAD